MFRPIMRQPTSYEGSSVVPQHVLRSRDVDTSDVNVLVLTGIARFLNVVRQLPCVTLRH